MSGNREKHPHSNRSEKQIDEAVENTFPASDAPSTGGKTRIESDGGTSRDERDHRDDRDTHKDDHTEHRSSHGSR